MACSEKGERERAIIRHTHTLTHLDTSTSYMCNFFGSAYYFWVYGQMVSYDPSAMAAIAVQSVSPDIKSYYKQLT